MATFKHTGRVNPVPDGLVSVGPIVKVTLLPHPADVDKMLAEGITPKGAIANMMVDTGAARTLIDDSIAQDLRLKPLRLTPIIGVSQKPMDCPVYRMQMQIKMADGSGRERAVAFVADIVGMPSSNESIGQHQGLIGRDFLRYVKFVYDGPTGSFEIIDRTTEPPSGPQKTGHSNEVAKRRQKNKKARQSRRRSNKKK